MILSFIKKIANSIALVPTLLALSFLLLAILLISIRLEFKDSDIFNFLVIEEKKDVQSIFAFIIGGIFTLTVFSYTMVMNVLNRNISNYSPRLIPMLLSEKHHQIILGFTSGTIIYCLILSIELNNNSNDYFPGFAASLGIIFSIICVFLFIYFIHSVSQSIHINYILHDVFQRTSKSLQHQAKELEHFKGIEKLEKLPYSYSIKRTGYLHRYDFIKLSNFALKKGCRIHVHKLPGSFVYHDDHLLTSDIEIDNQTKKALEQIFAVDHEVPLDIPEIGFKHLVEVAVKASSPAINDPATSKTCIDYLTQLFIIRMNGKKYAANMKHAKSGIVIRQYENSKLMRDCYKEMYGYMKEDYLLPKILSASIKTIENRTKSTIDFKF